MRIHPVIQFIQQEQAENRDPFSSLAARGIYRKNSSSDSRLFSLNYDQIEARNGDSLVEQSRGLVLWEADPDNFVVAAQPFVRFYNLGQEAAAELDWSSAVFQEKLDGTLLIVYKDPRDRDKWCVATRNVPEADVPCADGRTFTQKFWGAVEQHQLQPFLSMFEIAAPDSTLLFELVGPDNQIVLPYDQVRLVFLAAFNNITGIELEVPEWNGLERPRKWHFLSAAEAAQWVSEQPGTVLEGVVAQDSSGLRVKIKNANYLALSKVMTAAGSDRGLLELILSGTADDSVSFLPAVRRDKLQQLESNLRDFCQALEEFCQQLPKTATRKEAALQIQEDTRMSSWIGPILEIWSGKLSSFSQWLAAEKVRRQGFSDSLLDKLLGELD